MDFFCFFKGQDRRKQQLRRSVQKQDFCPVNSSWDFNISFQAERKKNIKKKNTLKPFHELFRILVRLCQNFPLALYQNVSS